MTRVRNLCNARCVRGTVRRWCSWVYARVSTRDQHPEAQTDALTAAGCERIFTDNASGTLSQRPALEEALRYLRGDDTLVVTKLDRLGRSVRNLSRSSTTCRPAGSGCAR